MKTITLYNGTTESNSILKTEIRDGSITELFRKPLPDEKVTFIPDEFTVVEMNAVSAVIKDSNGNRHAVPTKLLMLATKPINLKAYIIETTLTGTLYISRNRNLPVPLESIEDENDLLFDSPESANEYLKGKEYFGNVRVISTNIENIIGYFKSRNK